MPAHPGLCGTGLHRTHDSHGVLLVDGAVTIRRRCVLSMCVDSRVCCDLPEHELFRLSYSALAFPSLNFPLARSPAAFILPLARSVFAEKSLPCISSWRALASP